MAAELVPGVAVDVRNLGLHVTACRAFDCECICSQQGFVWYSRHDAIIALFHPADQPLAIEVRIQPDGTARWAAWFDAQIEHGSEPDAIRAAAAAITWWNDQFDEANTP